MDDKKTDIIRLRVSKEMKEQYNQLCKEKAINSSELLRQFIVRWLEENKKI